MTGDDLCYISAAEALRLFRSRKLSPRELMAAIVARAGMINPIINCFADNYFEEALAQAAEAEQRYTKRSGAPAPLDGIPLAVKDAQRVAGKRTTHGSLIFKDARDDRSDPMIERLQKAGAIVFARTTTPEFCLSGATHSRMWGITRNPWNRDYGPGGSSGGSGAALAAGLATLATGTDIGGSIRIPASACGGVGFQPPQGRNPDGPPGNFDRYNHCGPMTRTIADAALMQNITSGPHPLDHDSIRDRVRLPLKGASIKGMKIAYSIDFGYVEVDPEVRRNTLQTLDVFRRLGAKVEEVETHFADTHDMIRMMWPAHYAGSWSQYLPEWRDKMDPGFMACIEDGLRVSLPDYIDMRGRKMAHWDSVRPLFEKHDLLLTPSVSVAAFPLGRLNPEHWPQHAWDWLGW
ncbi:MAG: amidase, partial [Methylocella sp.]